jgi:predicted esterase
MAESDQRPRGVCLIRPPLGGRIRTSRAASAIAAALLLVAFGPRAIAQSPAKTAQPPSKASIFDIGKDRAQRAVVTTGESLPEFSSGGPEMALVLSGVLAELRTAKDLEALRACVPANPMIGDAGNADRICTIHLYTKEATKKVGIYRDAKADYVAVELDSTQPDRLQLKRDAFAALAFGWPGYRGSFSDKVTDPIGTVFQLPKPLTAGRFTIDQQTLGERFLAGGTTDADGADRVLADEKLDVRLPRGYSARKPAGLLIWVSPMATGSPPEAFWPALDAMNLVCIGPADAGNHRRVTNRYQLVFDALASASARYHIDPRRVYLTGMSGGGKVASNLQGCFPDVFAGAVPIVGLTAYETIPSGTGQYYRASYEKPKAPIFNLLKTRRIAAMTGRKDFNEVPVQQASALMQRDGLQVKLFEDPKMGHELPKPEQFLAALMWVDEPYRKVRDAEQAAAKKAMDACRGRFKGKMPDAAGERVLWKVMEAGAWTEGAWEAAGILGLDPENPQVRTPER